MSKLWLLFLLALGCFGYVGVDCANEYVKSDHRHHYEPTPPCNDGQPMTPTPEPATPFLLGLGLSGVWWIHRRNR